MHALYPGSFDPFTTGHLDIVERGLKIFPEITIVVAESAIKNALFTTEERVELIRKVLKDGGALFKDKGKRVQVASWGGLTMDYARKHNAVAVVRGLRAASDFEYEFMMASMNRKIDAKIETVFIMSSSDLYFVSSTMIKELYLVGGDVKPYVPPAVFDALKRKKPVGAKK